MINNSNGIKCGKRQTAALVTGADHPTGLGGARSLHAFGTRVFGLAGDPRAITCRSRAWEKVYDISGADLFSALHSLGNKLEQPIFLLPTTDSHVSAVSSSRSELPGAYRFVLPKDEIVQTFLDKTRFYKWAAPLGLPLPYSRIVENKEELFYALKHMSYPLILKPLWRTSSWNRFSPVRKGYKLESATDINRIPFNLFSASSSFILSQWIEGPDDSVYYCLAYCGSPGEITRYYTGRKLLQYPRQSGSTAICVGVENGEVTEIAREVFRQAEFEGLGSVEIKYDCKGQAFITEPTVGRPNLQSYSAVVAGCNLQGLAMDFALGRNSSHANPSSGNCWWVEESALFELATTPSPALQSVPWRLLIKELLRARRLGGAYWDRKDPFVLVNFFLHKMSKGVSKVSRVSKLFWV